MHSQQSFSLSLVESNNSFSPAVHSGAFVVHNGKWLLIGGRKNGLHGFQPPFAFLTNGINDSIFVCDVDAQQKWSASIETLPDSIREPISSSNMEFYANDSILYMVGGYGWKDAIQNFVTWPTLTAINMNGLMNAVVSNQPIAPYFRQLIDTNLAICGAHLQKLDSTYYLVFGHLFNGYYDRSDTTGFHRQQYSYEIRKFQIQDDGTNLAITNYSAIRDTANFRRRDYNLVPGINTWTGKKVLTAYSGVFRKGIDLPHLNCVDINDTGYAVINTFNQNLSQYHSAFAALYDSANYTQHTLFFGGMSMFYYDTLSGNLVQDSFVPFVQTISDVVRNLDGDYYEFNTGVRFPALLGTNAYFLPDHNAPIYREEFIHLNRLSNAQRIGYIIGGIESPELNISLTDPSLSYASTRMFEVYLVRDTTSVGILNPTNNDITNVTLKPNPASQKTELTFDVNKTQKVKISITDMQGRVVKEVCNKQLAAGKQKLLLDISDYPKGVYNCSLQLSGNTKTIRLMKE